MTEKNPKPYRPRAGSRPHALSCLEPGGSLVFESAPGCTQALMQQIGVDARRVGVSISVSLLLAIEPRTRAVFELVRVTRKPDA